MKPEQMRPHKDGVGLTVISLFTGAGGLDLGLEAAGFEVRLCVEMDEDARKTTRTSRPGWNLAEHGDIFDLEPEEVISLAGLSRREAFIVAGGPPCQPFSKSGYWVNGDARRMKDPRSHTLKAYMDVVEAALPQIFLIENVKGLSYRGKSEGLDYLKRRVGQMNKRNGTRYTLSIWPLNAARYGVPQTRERLFILGTRDGRPLVAPKPSFASPEEVSVSSNSLKTFRTAWDAIGDLDDAEWPEELEPTGKWSGLLPSIPEGKNYLWHTAQGGGLPIFGWRTKYWSFLLKLAKSMPSWTLQAEPGPATGPFHWRNRLLSVREMCRLQTFPDGYEVQGKWRSAQRQVGNAVPPALGELIGLEIRKQLEGHLPRCDLALIPEVRNGCPGPERRRPVPKAFKALAGKHAAHPGVGKGPGAMRKHKGRARR